MAFRADPALGQLLENRTVTYGIFGSPDQSVKEGRPDIEHMAVRFTVSEVARTGILDAIRWGLRVISLRLNSKAWVVQS